MDTLAIQIDEQLLERTRIRAQEQGVTIDVLIALMVLKHVDTREAIRGAPGDHVPLRAYIYRDY